MEESKVLKKEIALGEPGYINKNCFLASNLGYPPTKHCQYCEMRFHNCVFFRYMIISLVLVAALLATSLVIERSISRTFIISVFVLVITYGYFFDKSTQEIIEASFAQRKAKEALEELTRTLQSKVDEQTEDLKKAYEKEVALLKSIGEGVIAVGENGKIIFVNKVAEDMLGLSAEQLVGKLFGIVCRARDEKGAPVTEKECPIAIALKGQTTVNLSSFFYTKKDGSMFPVSITSTPVMTGDKITGAIEVFHDMTKEKEIEKLRMDFLSLASHQLRTPLSGTKWLIETMRRGLTGKIEKKEKEYLDSLYQMNERMIKLVFDMLSVLRLESDTEPAKKETVAICDVYKDIISAMSAPAGSKGVILKSAVSKASGKIEVKTDVQLFKTIIECFVSNAINYTPAGKKISLDVKETPEDSPNPDTIVFSVKDEGIGIPEEEKSKIFERFYRASNAKLFKPDGTGLGLYIAHMLAGKIGGEIHFDSKYEKGSTFYLSLPKNKNQ